MPPKCLHHTDMLPALYKGFFVFAGQVILKLRRPMYLINSTIYVEDGEGNVVGEVRQRFHVWQRNYDIYLDKRQVAAINSPLLAWEFAIKDEQGGDWQRL